MADNQTTYDFGFKTIRDYTPEEVDLAVKIAVEHCKRHEIDFYAVLRGVDAYMEKRRRKVEAAAKAGGR